MKKIYDGYGIFSHKEQDEFNIQKKIIQDTNFI